MWKWRSRDECPRPSHTPHRLQTTADPGAGGRRGCNCAKALLLPLDDLLAVVRAVPQSACFPLGPRPLPAAAWGRQPAGAETEGAQARARHLQGLRTRLPAHRHQVSGPRCPTRTGRRYPLRGHRPGDALGLRALSTRRKTAANARRFLRDLERAAPNADHPRADRQRQGFHRPPLRAAQARGHRPARVRHALRRAWHRASPDPADAAADERHGSSASTAA